MVVEKVEDFTVVGIEEIDIEQQQYREDKGFFYDATCFNSGKLQRRETESNRNRKKPWNTLFRNRIHYQM